MPLHRLPLAALLGLIFCLAGRSIANESTRLGINPKAHPRAEFRNLITPVQRSELLPQDDAPVETNGLVETAFR